jgi:hypothetical protein
MVPFSHFSASSSCRISLLPSGMPENFPYSQSARHNPHTHIKKK